MPGIRVCSVPGCPTLIYDGNKRCDACRHKQELARGTRRERGYTREFDASKRDQDYRNATHCQTCGSPFTESNPRTAGHRVALRNGGRDQRAVPECRKCNYGWVRTGS